MQTISRSPAGLATLPGVLESVEWLIGPDILLYNVTHIIKQTHSEVQVSWYQDLTYRGLNADDQVNLGLALCLARCYRTWPRIMMAGHGCLDALPQ